LHRIRHLLVLTAALAAAFGVSACGGADSDADPAQVLRDTFSNGQAIESGVFDLSMTVDAGGDAGGKVELGLGGPFDGAGEGIPKFELTADVKADTPQGDFDFSGGLTSAGNSAFVNFQDTDYQVDQALFDRFATTFTQLQQQGDQQSAQNANFLKSLGIDPTNWLTDLQNDGIEAVEGVDTIKISGSADVPKLLQDIQKIAQRAGPAAQQISPAQLSQVAGAVETADFEIYSGVDDSLLRKISGTLEISPPGQDAVGIDFSLSFGEVNEPQTITAPVGAQPLSGLLAQFGIDESVLEGALGGLQGGLGGGLPQSGGSTAPPTNDAAQAYLDCLQTAQGQNALDKCAELIQ
jgi:hypothetical protein